MSNVQQVTDAILDAHRKKESTIPKMISSQYFKSLPIYDQRAVLKNLTGLGLKPANSLGSIGGHVNEGVSTALTAVAVPAATMLATNAILNSQDKIGLRAMARGIRNKAPVMAGISGAAALIGAAHSLYKAKNAKSSEGTMINALNSKDSEAEIDKYLLTGRFVTPPTSTAGRDIALNTLNPIKKVFIDDEFSDTDRVINDAFEDARRDYNKYNDLANDESLSDRARKMYARKAEEQYKEQTDYFLDLKSKGVR